MELIKNRNSAWTMEVTCTGYESSDYPCFSELIIEKEDIVFLRDYRSAYGFICPNCHHFTKITDNLLPYSIKANAPIIAEKDGYYYNCYISDPRTQLSEQQKKLCEIVIATDFRKNKEKEKEKKEK